MAMEYRQDDDDNEGSGMQLDALSRDELPYWDLQPLDTVLGRFHLCLTVTQSFA